MSIARKLTIGSIMRVLAHFSNVVAVFFLTPFMVHTLGDRTYGLWALVGTMVGYSGLLTMGFGSAMIRFLARAVGTQDRTEYRRVYNTAIWVYLVFGGVIMLAGVIAAAFSRFFVPTAADAVILRQLILIVAAKIALYVATRSSAGALNAHLRYDRTALADTITALLRSVGMGLPLLLGYGVVGVAWGGLAGSVPGCALTVYFDRRDLPPVAFGPPDRPTARQMFAYSVFALVGQFADLLRTQMNAPIVASFAGLAAVTHYRIAGALTGYANETLVAALNLFPAVFSQQEGQKDFAAIRKTLLFTTKLALIIGCFVTFGMIAWGRPFIARWMGAAYLDAYPCLVWLACGCLIYAAQLPGVSLLFGVSRHKVYAGLNLSEGAAGVICAILLARRFGMTGVAAGAVLPMLVIRGVILPVYVCRVAGIPARQFFRLVARTGGAAALPLGVSYLAAAPLAQASYLSLALAAVLAVICYLPAVWFLAFSAPERLWLLSLVRRRSIAAPAGA